MIREKITNNIALWNGLVILGIFLLWLSGICYLINFNCYCKYFFIIGNILILVGIYLGYIGESYIKNEKKTKKNNCRSR